MYLSLQNIVENVLSEFIFVILAALLALAIGWVFYRSSRQKLLRFFGIYETRRINIYLSNIRVIQFGSIGIDGQKRSFFGDTVSFEEMLVASNFRNLFVSPFPSLSQSLASFLSGWLISDIQLQIQRSPTSEEQIDTTVSFITLGSPGYNIVSQYVETKLQSHAKFASDYSSMLVPNLPPISGGTYGFIERIFDETNGSSQFYAAGLSVLGTAGATRYLSKEWKRLERKYRQQGFTIVLMFDVSDPSKYTVVMEHEHSAIVSKDYRPKG